jgi:IMP dehydrogenase
MISSPHNTSLYNNKILQQALTFDDVLLVPAYSQILPHETQVYSSLSSRCHLKIPILSAAMDTITNHKLATTIAHLGGLGVIHKNLSPEEQAHEISLVKNSQNGVVINPITVSPNDNVGYALSLMLQKNISGLPVVESGKLKGIVTGRDVRFEKNLDKPISSIMTPRDRLTVLTKDEIHTPWQENIHELAKETLHTNRVKKLPVVDKDNNLLGLITRRDIENAIKYPNASQDLNGKLLVGAATGVGPSDLEKRVPLLIDAGADVLVVDTAHGHSKGVIQAVRKIKDLYGNKITLIAGNIATGEAAKALADAGADCVKVGIGPGSICTTRMVAGVGVPQMTAVLNVAEALRGSHVKIISDGGIKYSGDIVKALAAGAHTVMLGSLLAGTDESPGERISYQGKVFKRYRGMGSLGAMKLGSKDRYFQGNESDNNKLVPEGIEGQVPYKGPLSDVIHQLVGGLKAGLGYTGAHNIEDLHSKSQFVQITNAGLRESHVHDVTITEEAPNYSLSRN